MNTFLGLCEKLSKDPIEVALSFDPPGTLCTRCQCDVLNEKVEAGDPQAIKAMTLMKMQVRGMKVIK